ncbi:MAG: hypothetical protein OS130_13540 [Thermodesulfobacteriota bacterium]|jgi:hypothetical protein|nr:MAG: hypothetical protein OS130_13540 [Thermodesulfobacteriota bacterium]
MENYLGVAKEAGITDQEIGTVQAIVMAISGGRVMAQFGEVLTRSRVAKRLEQPATGNLSKEVKIGCCKE